MEDKKYYSPSIEDMRIGYECEMQTNNGYIKGVYPDILECNTELNEFGKDSLMKAAHAILRTEYLTKEQMEAEGWEQYNEGYGEHHQPWYIPYKHKTIKNLKLEYTPYLKDHEKISCYLTIYEDCNKEGEKYKEHIHTKYSGKCPSVNEFRQIMKWVGIM